MHIVLDMLLVLFLTLKISSTQIYVEITPQNSIIFFILHIKFTKLPPKTPIITFLS